MNKSYFKKIFSAAFLVFVMAGIVYLTFQTPDETMEMTGPYTSFVSVINTFVNGRAIDPSLEIMGIRKLAHAVEYGILGLAAVTFFRTWNSRHPYRIAVLWCAVSSVLDQLSKLLVPGREFDCTDLPFDFLGYLLMITLVYALAMRKNKK